MSTGGDTAMCTAPHLWKAGNHSGYVGGLQSHRPGLEHQASYISVCGTEIVII